MITAHTYQIFFFFFWLHFYPVFITLISLTERDRIVLWLHSNVETIGSCGVKLCEFSGAILRGICAKSKWSGSCANAWCNMACHHHQIVADEHQYARWYACMIIIMIFFTILAIIILLIIILNTGAGKGGQTRLGGSLNQVYHISSNKGPDKVTTKTVQMVKINFASNVFWTNLWTEFGLY